MRSKKTLVQTKQVFGILLGTISSIILSKCGLFSLYKKFQISRTRKILKITCLLYVSNL
jgi:hypothetical protein